MFLLETQRLKLIPLSNDMLTLCHQNRALMEKAMGLNKSSMDIDSEYENEVNDAMVNFWIPKTSEYPGKFQWYTSWEIVLSSTNTSIGGIGFAGYPNNNGETEVGFMIDKQHHRKGFALEALLAMIEWAMKYKETGVIIAQTLIENIASQNLLLKAGFEQTGISGDLMKFGFVRRNMNNLIMIA